MQPIGRAGLLLISATAAGCFDVPGEFRCSTDDQCHIAGVQTRCENPPGYCSAEALDCPVTQHRYLDNAGPLANHCVGPGDTDGGALFDGSAGDGPLGLDGGAESCARPYLMITVEDHSAPASAVGRVLRFALDGTGKLNPCSPLTGAGSLGALPRAATFVPPRFVGVAARDAIYLVDGTSDQVQWSYPNPSIGNVAVPVDIVPIVEPTGGTLELAVGYSTGGSLIDTLYVYRDGATAPMTWDVNTGLNLATGIGGFTQQQPPTSNFWALVDGTYGSIADNPFTKMKTSYIPVFGGTDQITTIYELDAAGMRRTVWIDDTANAVFHVSDDGSAPSPIGPTKCAGGVTCTFTHAVPDPTMPDAYFVLCEEPASSLNDVKVERLTGAGACTIVFDGKTALDTDHRPTRLGVAMP